MIDIHNHVLPGLDDGPKTNEEAIKLLEQAKSENVDKLIVTPHHLHNRYTNDYEKVRQALTEFQDLDEVQKIGIELYIGQEIRITDQIVQGIEDKTIQGINGSKYLLVELPSNEVPYYTKSLIFDLQNKGFVPIIAHPERNKAISKDPDLLYDLIRSGALGQITSASLNGNNGKKLQKLCLDMIESNLIHFIASDAHNAEVRPFLMETLFNNKKLAPYQDNILRLIENGDSIIKNEDVMKNIPEKLKKKKGLFSFFE